MENSRPRLPDFDRDQDADGIGRRRCVVVSDEVVSIGERREGLRSSRANGVVIARDECPANVFAVTR